jgi:NAD(P)H-hydrate repair Nnr-like enzyme with NAD(P)H-hydrate dehydratase domain
MGRLALSIRSARKLKSLGEKVILLLDVPNDRALDLILGRQIDGLATTYASTHDEVAARSSHIPTIMSFKGLVVEKKGILNVAEGVHIFEGDKVILDADSGSLMIAKGPGALVENGVEIFTPHDIEGLRVYQQITEKFKRATYEELLLAHKENDDRSRYIDDEVEEARIRT